MSNFLNLAKSMGFACDNYTSVNKPTTNPIKINSDGASNSQGTVYDELDDELTNKIQTMFGLFDTVNDDLIFDETDTKNSAFNINKTIEGSIQGDIEDCWLLSGLNSMSYTSKGAEIIKNSISVNNDNSYTVSFNGINQQVKITEDEMSKAKNSSGYSHGDDDVLLIELAVEKVFNKMIEGEIETPDALYSSLHDGGETTLSYGRSKDLYYLLTGNEGKTKYNEQYAYYDKNYDYSTTMDDIYNLIESSNNVSATISFYDPNATPYTSAVVWDVNDNMVTLVNGTDNHSWSIKSVQKDTVTITNPFDSAVSYTVDKKEIDEYTKRIDYCEL